MSRAFSSTAAISFFLAGLLLDFLLGLDLLQQGIALQFLAQDLLEFQGGDLQELERLLQPLGHHQLLPQLHALAQADVGMP